MHARKLNADSRRGTFPPIPINQGGCSSPEAIDRLAASIKSRGILQSLRVQRDAERGAWRIVAGESRWRAAEQAGLATVPCVVGGRRVERNRNPR